jgi:hypothetical protein
MVLFGGVLFLSGNVLVRTVTVVSVMAFIFLLTIRFPVDHVVRMLVVTVLVLLVLNAAFRSLYPLLIDPHNLLGSWQGAGFT